MLMVVAALFRDLSHDLVDHDVVTKRNYQSLVVGSDPDGFGLWLDQVPMICNSAFQFVICLQRHPHFNLFCLL